MFLDFAGPAGPGGEPREWICAGCKNLIVDADQCAEIKFGNDPKLERLNGKYHSECAKPILNLKRAYDMLGRLSGF